MLGGDFEKNATPLIEEKMLEHIREHKKFKAIMQEADVLPSAKNDKWWMITDKLMIIKNN